jgi:hypothetical protein
MKIRIKGNSLRMRLTKSEVAKFKNDGLILEQTHALGGVFNYTLLKSAETEFLQATWTGSGFEVAVPEWQAQQWTDSEEVGFQHIQLLPDGTELFLLVEKDFVCLDNTFEDQSDNYDNPNAVC